MIVCLYYCMIDALLVLYELCIVGWFCDSEKNSLTDIGLN